MDRLSEKTTTYSKARKYTSVVLYQVTWTPLSRSRLSRSIPDFCFRSRYCQETDDNRKLDVDISYTLSLINRTTHATGMTSGLAPANPRPSPSKHPNKSSPTLHTCHPSALHLCKDSGRLQLATRPRPPHRRVVNTAHDEQHIRCSGAAHVDLAQREESLVESCHRSGGGGGEDIPAQERRARGGSQMSVGVYLRRKGACARSPVPSLPATLKNQVRGAAGPPGPGRVTGLLSVVRSVWRREGRGPAPGTGKQMAGRLEIKWAEARSASRSEMRPR
ncbi:hypothetical protein EDB85DRAFT_1464509 [Lactarius pseudohatsudake]|nr:hypothetical protein EDB85DRAFT_1464509 [Lactarius pseudohatsudake]